MQPLFRLDREDQWRPSNLQRLGAIRQVVSASDTVVVATSDNQIIRWSRADDQPPAGAPRPPPPSARLPSLLLRPRFP